MTQQHSRPVRRQRIPGVVRFLLGIAAILALVGIFVSILGIVFQNIVQGLISVAAVALLFGIFKLIQRIWRWIGIKFD